MAVDLIYSKKLFVWRSPRQYVFDVCGIIIKITGEMELN